MAVTGQFNRLMHGHQRTETREISRSCQRVFITITATTAITTNTTIILTFLYFSDVSLLQKLFESKYFKANKIKSKNE